MSNHPRRRTNSITRGRKSDRKKKKMEMRKKGPVEDVDGLSAFREKSDKERKQLLRDGSPGADKSILSEPSSLFYQKTENIRSKKKDSAGNVILLQQLEFQSGIGVSKVKSERMLVIKGASSSIFQELDSQYHEQKNNLKQEQRVSQTDVLEKFRKRQTEQQNIAAAQMEEIRPTKEKIELEESMLWAADNEKLESERQAKLELERQEEKHRLQAMEQQKLESARLAKLDLESKLEASRKLSIKREEKARLEVIRKQKLEKDRLSKLDPESKQEKSRLKMIERENLSAGKNAAAKQKNGLWWRLFSGLRGLFKSKSTSDYIPIEDEIDLQPSRDFEVQDVVEEVTAQEEETIVEVHGNHPNVVKVSSEEIDIKPLQEVVVDDISEQEPVEVENEEITVTEQSIQPAYVHEEDLTENEVSSDDLETVLEATVTESPAQVSDVDSTKDEIVFEEESLHADEENSVPIHSVEPVTEYEPGATETEVSIGDYELQLLEEDITIADALPEGTTEAEEELEQTQTHEVVLGDLRTMLRNEPQALECIKLILIRKHNLSEKDVEILFDQVASPFSICKTMKAKLFEKFIASFEIENISSGGIEIWTQVIQLIGPQSLSKDQQIEIFELLNKGSSNLVRKVTTVALLYHFLPERFDLWWQKETVPEFVRMKYNSDYPYFINKNFSNQIVEEARMLLCAFAIEKPNLVANEYTYQKHKAGKRHEDRTETWLKTGGNIEYITEKDIPLWDRRKYGNKYVNGKITPDILLKNPIQLSVHGQHIHWIDAKRIFIDPALSPENKIDKFCNQIDKYVSYYGPGLVVWGKDFSEEWNEATEGVVKHIKI